MLIEPEPSRPSAFVVEKDLAGDAVRFCLAERTHHFSRPVLVHPGVIVEEGDEIGRRRRDTSVPSCGGARRRLPEGAEKYARRVEVSYERCERLLRPVVDHQYFQFDVAETLLREGRQTIPEQIRTVAGWNDRA
jgi:hypothetical protein